MSSSTAYSFHPPGEGACPSRPYRFSWETASKDLRSLQPVAEIIGFDLGEVLRRTEAELNEFLRAGANPVCVRYAAEEALEILKSFLADWERLRGTSEIAGFVGVSAATIREQILERRLPNRGTEGRKQLSYVDVVRSWQNQGSSPDPVAWDEDGAQSIEGSTPVLDDLLGNAA